MQQTMQPLLCIYANFSPVHPMKEHSHHCESPLLQNAGLRQKGLIVRIKSVSTSPSRSQTQGKSAKMKMKARAKRIQGCRSAKGPPLQDTGQDHKG